MTPGLPASRNPVLMWRRLPRWRKNILLLTISQSFIAGSWSFMSPLYPLFIQEELGVNDPAKAAFWAGFSSTFLSFTMATLGPLWGYLADRYGRKPVLLRAYLGGALVLMLNGMVTNIWQLLIIRVLHGALSGSVGSAMALGASVVPRNRIPLAVGMLQFAVFFAFTLGPLVGAMIASLVGFRATYFVSAGIAAGVTVMVFLLISEEFERAQDSQGRGYSLLAELKEVVTTKGVVPALAVVAIVQGAPAILQPVIPGFIQLITDSSRAITGSGYAFGALGLTSGIAALFIGRYNERLNLRAVLIACCFGASAAFLSQFFVHNYVIFLGVTAVIGLFTGGMLTSINSMVGMIIPRKHLGAAFGVVNSANSMAWGISPLAGGSLAWTIGFRRVFPSAALVLALTGVTVALVLKGLRAPEPERQTVAAAGKRKVTKTAGR